jgi:aldose 1-epimerase
MPVKRGRSIGVRFTHVDKDGAQGYPGTLTVNVTHWLTEKNIWRIEYSATVADKATPINLTNHAYFNLKGICNGTIEDHELQIFADATTPTDKAQIPTGEIKPVDGTPFDFRKPRVIADGINADDEQIKIGKGYDHNWVLSDKSNNLKKAAVLSEKTTGRKIEVWTTEPAIQIYCGNMIGGGKNQPNPITEKCGKVVPYRGAICLETQHFPDSPNKPEYPTTVLRPEEEFKEAIIWQFSVA